MAQVSLCPGSVSRTKPKKENGCTPHNSKLTTLEDMLKDYDKTGYNNGLKSLKNGQPEELWFTNFICGKVNISLYPEDKKFRKSNHQYRMPYDTVVEARKVLESANLESLNTFDDILREVIKVTKPVEYFGPLGAYDFTLRYCFSRDIFPEKVYVHAGTKDGLTALAEIYPDIKTSRDKVVGETIEASMLSTILVGLECHHIENFLCIYDENINKLAKKITLINNQLNHKKNEKKITFAAFRGIVHLAGICCC